jgi:c-di-GMP-related signal transduction protein
VVGEILETVKPDEEVLAACRRLKKKGYRLALDDYEDGPEMEPFFELVDFVKIDFLLTSPEDRRRLGQKFHRLGIPLVAEKVETLDQFHGALAMGYQYFQGYFFCRPQTLSRRAVPRNRVTYLRILQMFSSSRIDLEELSRLIRQEVSLSYRLLRYLNSPAFPVVGEVRSIPQALSLLGESMSRKWLAVVCIASMAEDKPGELVKLSLSRASFCELLAGPLHLPGAANELFLLGLLSVMDALLDMPMAEILEKLPLDSRIKDALVGQPSDLSPVLDIVLQYESGEWEGLAAASCALGFDQAVVPGLYLRSVEWADQILSAAAVTSER